VDDLIVLYDGDCGFCRVMMAVLLRWDRANRVLPMSIQSPRAEEFLIDMDLQDRLGSWHLIDAEGIRHSGGAAIPVIFDALPWGTPIARVANRYPRATTWAYDWVANRRVALGRPLKRRAQAWAAAIIAERERPGSAGGEGETP
jgi:predicted DCC family thiol-disulfide oxidoreductase YuxK